MNLKKFLFALNELKNAALAARARALKGASTTIPAGAVQDKPKIYDFHSQREKYLSNSLKSRVDEVRNQSACLAALAASSKQSPEIMANIFVNMKFLEEYSNEPGKIIPIIDKMNKLCNDLILYAEEDKEFSEHNNQDNQEPKHARQRSAFPRPTFSTPKVPDDIRSGIVADVEELGRAFNAECYRSSVILCGRILEAALHRKYYDSTGHDILEKNPGIGLGTLVAKLSENNIKLDVGITQQIHLINQVRIFSVHKKQEAFAPTKDQTQAIILYTLDAVNKLF
ncbi:hypothetical protein HY772_04210 [Candidatus Woesearchaeota archaeon]|nr:hypothetical protein [Candidatus Woesearchaeota archaeon]